MMKGPLPKPLSKELSQEPGLMSLLKSHWIPDTPSVVALTFFSRLTRLANHGKPWRGWLI